MDGGFKSGVDVVMGALMGGDEYGFGSVAMIATGCIMARICHTNNCPVGVASQVPFFSSPFCASAGLHQLQSCAKFRRAILVLLTADLQREELRARFPGVPGDLVNYFLFVAEEVSYF